MIYCQVFRAYVLRTYIMSWANRGLLFLPNWRPALFIINNVINIGSKCLGPALVSVPWCAWGRLLLRMRAYIQFQPPMACSDWRRGLGLWLRSHSVVSL